MYYNYNFTPRSFYRLVRYVVKHGAEIYGTKELINFSFRIKNPRDRIVSLERNINFPFAVAEWLSNLTGEGKLKFFKTFISDYDRYSTDGINVDGAYGPRIYSFEKGNQIEGIIEELSLHSKSRRAVISIYNGIEDIRSKNNWIPCTETLQFIIREGKLHTIVNMRSNDVYLGVPYDIFSFTMMQEYVAMRLGIPLGYYFHNAGSFHIYERHYEMAKIEEKYVYPYTMSQMNFLTQEIFSLKVIYDDIEKVDLDTATKGLSPYLADLAWSAKAFIKRKNHEEATYAYEKILDPAIKRVMVPWIKKEK